MTNETKGRGLRRWWQFSLRGLLLLVLLVALGLLALREYLKPYWRQQKTVALVEQLGGSCQTVEVDRWWLKLLGGGYNVTQVNLADCDDPDAYVAEVTELPAIELLIVGGPVFTDEHAQRLHGLRKLKGLILDCTSVSDNGVAALREALSETEVYVSQRRAIEALRALGIVEMWRAGTASTLQQLGGDQWFQEARLFAADRRFGDIAAPHLRYASRLQEIQFLGPNNRLDLGEP